MKPERIQFAALLRAMIWGVFQILPFETPAKAKHFRNFIRDMAENHDLSAACKMGKTRTRVTLLVAANAEGDIAPARAFADKVLDIFAVWSSADEEFTPAEDTPAEDSPAEDTPADQS